MSHPGAVIVFLIDRFFRSVEKKKAESLLMDKEKKRDKSRKDVGRLEKDLADLTKELQNLATPSKLMVSLLVMAIMFVINRRQEKMPRVHIPPTRAVE